ncbi:hypothetical protein K443DRAFT_112109, partial [Laccaria amethystina LaAM-08-1]
FLWIPVPFLRIPVPFLRIPVPFLRIPVESSGMAPFLQESVGQGEVLYYWCTARPVHVTNGYGAF